MCAMQSMTMMVYETVFIPNNSLSGVEHRKINTYCDTIDKMTSCYYYTKFRGTALISLSMSLTPTFSVCVFEGRGGERVYVWRRNVCIA